MRIFAPDEIAAALEQRGFADIHQRISGMVQFVGARLAHRRSPLRAIE